MKEPFLEGHTSVAATEFSTIVEILQWRAFHHPDQKAYAFFTYGEEEYGLTYAALERKSRAIGAMLQKLGASGERVLLLYPPELDYISAFFGCLYAGAIAVPAYPPHSSRSIERVQSIVADAQAKFVLTTDQMMAKIQRSLSLVPDLQALQWLVTDQECSDRDEIDWQMPQITGNTIAFIQYTSGSTGSPKGVMVSHGNLLSNHRMIQSALAHPVEVAGSPFVSWLPLFHDMGLISKMLQALYAGSPCIFLPSSAFLQSPFRWLQTISLYQASTSGAPNFAYDLCVQKITPTQRDTLDLRSWSVAFCGAEPIRSQTLQKFASYFASCGFRIEALKPVYGLAEATLFVTGHPRNFAPVVRLLQKEAFEENHVILTTETDEKRIECTSCGKPVLDARVVIVDPETCLLSTPGTMGEIWIAGSHVAQGYWNRHEETEETFRAFVKETGEGPFLRTGDLGFLLDGNLFITGRQKDLIIIRGQNYYPQDIENVAELSHPALKSNASAAFSLEVDGNERVILVMEIDRQHRHQEPQELFVAIRQGVFEKYNVHVYAIVLIRPGSMLRTSSGKIQRRACRTAFLEQNLAIMFADLPQGVKGLLEPRAGEVAFASPPMQAIQSVPTQRSPSEIVAAQDHTLTGTPPETAKQAAPLIPSENKQMQFSLLYFSSYDSGVAENKYELLLEGAKFADQHDFTAIWVPERHFHPFGGLYPNPSTLASALAVITQKIRLRAGSVVLPMHHPVRVAEEWSVVDNLSSGRVDLAFAIGWNPNDFILAPAQYEQRKDLLFSGIETFQKLWRGDEILFPNGLGKETSIKIYPLPVQSTLTPWITCTSSPERFREAGAMGANVLTGLLFQSREELAEKINAYRNARAQHGYDPATGHVTLMMHTFIGDDLDEVRQIVRPAFIAYLKSSVDLWRHGAQKLNDLTLQEQEQVLSYAFERYFQTHALFGTPQTASKIIDDLSAIGVDEIACLIDFGIDNETVMDGLHFLNSLRKRFQKGSTQPKKRMGESKNAVSLQKTQGQFLTIQATENAEDEKHTPSQSALVAASTAQKNAPSDQRGTSVEPDLSLLQQLSRAPLGLQLQLLEEYIQQQIAQVLELSVQDISGVLNIRSLGLDSLMIMNVVNNCQRDLLMTVDAGQFYEHTSFRSLALYMIEELHRAHPTEKRTTLVRTGLPLLPRPGPRTIFPASFAQQRLWFLHQLQPDATAYNVLILLGIKGDLVVDALEWSLKEIIHRHESLRTSLTLHEGQPVQVVHETTGFTLSQIALNHLPSEAWEVEVHKLARQESQHPFDLTQGSLIRAKLLLLGQHEYALLFTYHHVVIDGWSRSILLRELQALYTASIADQPSPLEDLSIQYADYTLWQRQWLSRPLDIEIRDTSAALESQPGNGESGQTLLEQQLAYWKTQLVGPLPLLVLPTDSPRPAVQTFHGAHLTRQLPAPLMDALKKLSKGEEVTLFMTLLASFQVVLARYSGQDDILIGTLIAGRNRAEIEPLIGFFLNTLVLRTNLAGNPTFHDLLQRVRDVCLGAYAHQDVPFEQIVEAIHPERDLSRHPLFQVMFLLEETSWWLEAELPGVNLQQLPTESGISLFDLTCSITGQGFTEIEYNTDLFAASTIERLLRHWQLLLQQIIAQPHLPLSALSIVSPQEREQLLGDWNQTTSPHPSVLSLPQQIAEWADRTPDRIAISYREEQLSYGELDQRASRLARHLQEQGAGPDTFVAIFAERSPALMVGILAVFKVGGAYIPLDPTTPPQRLAQILAEAQPPLMLTTRELATHLPPLGSTSLVWLETILDSLSLLEPSWHQEDGNRQQLAYVIYTSGSTGKPKGVMIHQQGMLNHLYAKIEDLGVQAQDCVAQNASTSFDISVWQMWSGLLQGGRVHVLSSEEAHLPQHLWRCVHEQAITILQLVPSLLRLLLDELEGEKVGWLAGWLAVRVLLATGEALPLDLSQRWLQQYPGIALVNAYGPTECSDDVTHAWLEADLERVPIGRPLRNTQLYPLDRWMELVPVGMVGELYVGGEGVGRGYLFAPEQTARSFVPHPWSQEPGARLYRTGDLVRYWEDGQLDYLGRVDEQVKLRGYRIELGEIEAVVRTYPTIQEAVLLVREDDGGEKCLVAYVVGAKEGGGEPFVERDLRAYVQERLPAYMVPMYFVELMALPFTPNGKVDRRSLPAPEKRVFTVEQNGAIRTPIEEIILGIYRTVLGTEQVSLHKSFFDQGGHSLSAIQVISRLREVLHIELPLKSLFEKPSVVELAQQIDRQMHRQQGQVLPPILPVSREQDLPLSFAQQRLWFLHQLQPDATAYNVLILLGIKGDLVVDALEWSLKEIIHRHEILRTSLTLHEGQPVQVVHETTGFTLSQIALNHLPSEAWDVEVHKLARQESQHPFDLTQGSLLRAKLLLLDQHEYALLFTYHHIVIDGWSSGILLRELQALYTAYLADQPSPLENLSIQYADYTLWQRQWLSRPLDIDIRDTSTQQENQRGSGEGGQILLEQQLTYWKTQLAGPLPLLALPTDSPRPAIQTFHGAHHARQLPVSLMDALKKLSKGEEVTLFMTLLASFQVLLARYSGQDDILIGTLIAGRNRAEIEPLIGFFLNTLALRTNLAGNPTFHDLLQRVRNVCLGAYAHQDVPFEQIVEVVHPERDLSRHPLFQVMFLLEETSWWLEAELPGVSLQQIPTESGLSLFDLTCSITAQGFTEIEYNTDLFAASTIERLLHQWQLLLQQIIVQPYLPLSALSVVSPQERELMLGTWNQTRSPNPGAGSLPQQLAQWADRTPDRIALSFQEEQLSYGELDQRASRLARHLQEQGVGPETFVAIFAERSPALIVGILAVFKVGGAYIPLDPSTPSQRLAQILAEARPPLVLTTRELATHLPPVDSTSLVWLETIGDPVSRSEPSWHQEDGDRQQLAYVIYTSGSTGKPKGVMIHQQGMLNHLVAKIEDLGLQAQDCVAQNASTSFDISVWQMWSGLMQGGRVHVLSSEEAHLPLQLWRCLHEQAITILQLVPSLLRLLLDALEGEKVRRSDDGLCVRVLLATGEALPSHLSQRWIQQYPGVALVNAYGPTECSDDVTHAWLEADLEQVPIGRPLRNTHLYPLDRWMELVPVGMVGELYVGGEGVGRGYLFAAEQTARSFVPDPWSPEPGARLYRTGDLVRYWEDGQLEYLGRVDEQVKLRGYRIELGEIEAVVRTYPTIQEAVLLVREDDAGEKCLVAYVVREQEGGGETFVERDLRAYVQEKLPEYMVPMYFVELMALPLTPNGKVDRRSLPAPEKRVFTVEQNGAIRTPIEEIILGIYRTVLGTEQVSLHKSFFDQGGHSLSAIQVISRLREVLHIELPLKSLFEKPSVVELAQQIDRQMHRQQGQVLPPILPVSREQDLPLSFAQQRLWFLHQLEPQSIAYLLPGKYRLRGVLNVQSLEKSLQELINRHESLRTTFEERVGQPIQIIHAAESYTLVVIDLQGLRHADREEHARCVAQMEAQHPCDLVTGPLLRTALLRLERQEHILLLTQHHIIADEWSGEIFVRELTLLYRAFMIGRPSSLTPLPIQYADYTLWQRGWLQGEVLEAQLAYWRGQLANMVPLELPADHPRQAVQTLQGAVQSLLLPLALSEALVMVSQQEQVTMFMTLLAAWQVLLQRYTGQHDISVGTPIANRRQVETENIIGFFVNTLVMRSDLSGDPTFAQVLQRIREVCLEAYAHQDVPFEQVVEDLAPARDMSRSPLFQVMLVLQNTPQEQMKLAGLQVLPLVIESVVSKFDLTLLLSETEQGLHCILEYNTDLFEAATIQRLLSHWQTILQGIVQNPQAHLWELPLLTLEEQEQLVIHWNATQAVVPQDLCVHQLFEQQVQRTPEAVALVCEGEALTYGELNRRANQVAHSLQTLGVGPEVLVGLYVERSLYMLMGILGILKAGGAYVPLDPRYPSARVAFLLEDAQMSVLVTQQSVQESLLPWHGHILCLDRDWLLLDCQKKTDLSLSLCLEQSAYIIYTSGSTGQPKGVQVSHANVTRLFHTTAHSLALSKNDIWTMFHSYAFDFSVWEIWGAFLYGGRLVVVPYWVTRSPDIFYSMLEEQAVTVLNQTPSAFQQVMQGEETQQVGKNLALRLIIFGGEALNPKSLSSWIRRHGFQHTQLVNMYGITETTVHVTSHFLTKTDLEEDRSSCIGRPLPDLQCYILDGYQQLLPVGLPGELYVGGMGLARGYVHRPELSAERFVPHSWSQVPGARLYRTGDLVRYRSDGTLEYLGRIDQQVKLRGYRIELGEIEMVLRKHQAVCEVAVVAREDRQGEKRLVAYVVGSEKLTSRELRGYLQDKLPEYMVPAFFVQLEMFPLTSHGKVERRMLPVPEEVEERVHEELQGAMTPIEELLVEIWSEVLARTQIGPHDNFFELGGHSLLATQLIARVRQVLEVEIPLRAVFEAPALGEFARYIEQTLRNNKGLQVPLFVPQERPEEIPLSFAQQRLWFLDQLEPGSTAYLLPGALRFVGNLNIKVLERSVEQLLCRHEILRTTFVGRSGQPIQVIHPATNYCLPVIDLQDVRSQEQGPLVQRLGSQEAHSPCDLANGPLLRMSVLRLQAQEHAVLLTLHHIITDAWSNEVIVGELTTLYQVYLTEQSLWLRPSPLQYADYALWQQRWLQGEVLNAHLDYWTEQLRGASPLELPSEHRPGLARAINRGAVHTFKLSSTLYQNLMALSHREGVTLFMTLLAAFQILLQRYTGMPDIVVGTDIANRTSIETEKMVGFFVNLLALRMQLSDQETFCEMLRRERSMVLDAYAHQDLPFEKLIDALQFVRDEHQSAFINVLFVLQNVPRQVIELPGLTVSVMETQVNTAKFDVAVFLTEEAQELTGSVNYRTDLFDMESMVRLVRHFEVLLQNITASPSIPIKHLGMFTEEEKERKAGEEVKKREKRARNLKDAKRRVIALLPDN